MDNMNFNPYENNPNNENSNQNPNPYGYPPYGYRPYRTANAFETASMTLGIASILSCTYFFLSFPLGALAITFALLSRGGKMEFGSKATVGLILGIVGLIVTIALYVGTLYIGIQEFGSFENLLRETCETMGYDFDALFGDMFQE